MCEFESGHPVKPGYDLVTLANLHDQREPVNRSEDINIESPVGNRVDNGLNVDLIHPDRLAVFPGEIPELRVSVDLDRPGRDPIESVTLFGEKALFIEGHQTFQIVRNLHRFNP
jgi:hypothetical protein